MTSVIHKSQCSQESDQTFCLRASQNDLHEHKYLFFCETSCASKTLVSSEKTRQTFEQKLSSFLHIHVTSREVHARKSTNWRRGQLIIAWWGFWKPKNSQGEEKNMKYITILDFLGREYVRYSEFSNWWLHKVQTRGSVIYSYLCFSLVHTNHHTIHQFSEKQIIKRQLASWSISTLSKLRSSEQALAVFQQQFSPACFNS